MRVSFCWRIAVLPADCEDSALAKESMLKLTRVFTLNSTLVLKRLCRLGDTKLNVVLEGLRSLYS
jgi:hypothetical protein